MLIGCCADFVVAQDNSAKSKSSDEEPKNRLWHSEKLPVDAVVRFGSTDRNPSAIGIYAMRFSEDGKLLAARDRRQNVRILDLEKQEVVAVLPTQAILDFVFSPDNKFLITGNRKTIQFWGIASGKIEREVTAEGYKLAMSSKPKELVAVGKGTVSRFPWPFPSKPKVTRTKLAGATILPAGVSEDGKFVIFHNGGKSELLDTVSGEPIDPAPVTVPKRAIISPNLHLLADLNYGDPKLKIFDLRNTQKYQYALSDKRRVVTAAFSCDSRFLYTSNYDNSIVIWDLVTMQAVHRAQGHGARIYALAPNPNLPFKLASGASGSGDRSVLYWDFRDRLFPPIEDTKVKNAFAFDQVWTELGSDDATISLAATNQLSRAMQNEPALMKGIKERLGIDRVADDDRAKKLIQDLDDPKYNVREKATMTLKSMAEQVRPMLERQLEQSSQEAKWRINRILNHGRLKPAIATASGRRAHRIVLALELCGSEAAVETLKVIARNSANQTIVELANAAILRLKVAG